MSNVLESIPGAIRDGLIDANGIESFRKKGYWISPKLFDDATIQHIRSEAERLWNGGSDTEGFTPEPHRQAIPKDPHAVRQMLNAWWISDTILQVATSPAIGKIAAALLETPEVRLWHDQLVWKPGQGEQGNSKSGNVGWHQDFAYWQCSTSTNMCTAWIALQDTDESNGCMFSIAGSHKWGLIREADTFYEQDMDKLKGKFASMGHAWNEEPCVMKAGEVSFHHSLCFHGSGVNKSQTPRLSVIAHLMSDEVRYAGPIQHHTCINLYPRPKKGERFKAEYNPVLWLEE